MHKIIFVITLFSGFLVKANVFPDRPRNKALVFMAGAETEFNNLGRKVTDIKIYSLSKPTDPGRAHSMYYSVKDTGEVWELFCYDYLYHGEPDVWQSVCSNGPRYGTTVCLDERSCQGTLKGPFDNAMTFRKVGNRWEKYSTLTSQGKINRYFQGYLKYEDENNHQEMVRLLKAKMEYYERTFRK